MSGHGFHGRVWYDQDFAKVYASAEGGEELHCAICQQPIGGKAFSMLGPGKAIHHECERGMLALKIGWSDRKPELPACGQWAYLRLGRRQLLRSLIWGELYVEATATLNDIPEASA